MRLRVGAGPRARRRAPVVRAAVLLVVLAAGSGCSGTGSDPAPRDEKTAPAPTDTLEAGRCPTGRNPGNLDYANYVMFGGLMYVSTSLDATVPPERLGGTLGEVRCSIDATNGNYWFVPRDLDAAFLPVGAPLRSIEGTPVEQQLAGRWEDGRWLVFTAETR